MQYFYIQKIKKGFYSNYKLGTNFPSINQFLFIYYRFSHEKSIKIDHRLKKLIFPRNFMAARYNCELVICMIIFKDMGTCESVGHVESRGLVQLIYSSTSNTSKDAALKMQELLEENKYLAPVINIGDIDTDELLNHHETIIFFLSTYGDGSSPSDGEVFLQWIEKLDPKQLFSHLNYAILAFGNSSFQHHCGFGLRTEKVLKAGHAKELLELTMCDAGSKQKNCDAKFPGWSHKLVSILNEKHKLREIPRTSLGSSYHATLSSKPDFQWEEEAGKQKNVGKQFSNYLHMDKCKVIHIKQLRKDVKDGRSTLWVRLQINKNVHLTPGCNVDVFPINSIQHEPSDNLVVEFSEFQGKIPFPPMPLGQIKKLLNYRKLATNKQIKNAALLSNASEEVAHSYNKRLKEKLQIKVDCQKLVEDLNPRVEFYPDIGLNTVRTYTLSSWDPENNYLDLCVSLVKNGLTSNYFKTHPEYIRIKTNPSTFYIPEKRPIVMIANGSGIAPFRSIVQYFASLSPQKRLPLRLYYGIQNENVDFYFDEEWKAYEKQGLVELRIAQSRKDPAHKQYVQDVLEKDVSWLTEHLFAHNGVIFICGGLEMSKSVSNVLFKALTAHVKMPYKAFSLSSELKQNKTIVEEVFG